MEKENKSTQKTIKHIVISGGHIWGMHALGAIQKCIEENIINMCHIKSIHGTSVGSIIGVILALKPNYSDIIDYFLNRPWHQLIQKYESSPLELYYNTGIFDIEFIHDVLSPILLSHDIPIDITLADFFLKTDVDLIIYVTEFNAYLPEELSYKTHPSWRLIDAIYASCALPIIFKPLIIDNKCYVDGGFLINYPLEKCIDYFEDIEEVFGISLGHTIESSIGKILKDSNMVDFVSILLMKIYKNVLFPHSKHSIPYEIKLYGEMISLEYILKCMNSVDERKSLYYYGYNHMDKCIKEDAKWRRFIDENVI
jgi:NTE family protein